MDDKQKLDVAKQADTTQQNFMRNLADEVAKLVIARLPKLPQRTPKKLQKTKVRKEAFGGIFLDTSAIIDGRIFDIIALGLFSSPIIIIESVLLELKHIADNKDLLKKARGKRALEGLSKIKKTRGVKLITLAEDVLLREKHKEVDELLIGVTKQYKGKLITCDFNLEKKAHVSGVAAVNVHALAQAVKVAAVPGESLVITITHAGKEKHQGVGYLPDGTMVVVEQAVGDVGKELTVLIARVIQTASGRILFSKKILH